MNQPKTNRNGEYVTLRDLDREVASKNLIMGAAATIFSTCMFTFFTMLIAMTPDPKGLINYPLVVTILFTFACLLFYGLWKIDLVDKYLKKGKQI
jgi:hypothetical protein